MKFSIATRKIVALSRKIQKYWDAELPKRYPNYPLVNPGESDGPPPAEEGKLKRLLQELSEEDVYQLLIVTHLGRGDIEFAEIAERSQSLREIFETSDLAISQMLNQPTLADDLEEGVTLLKEHGMDIDHLPLGPHELSRR